MNHPLFDVVFFGILQPGKNKETVMQNMAKLFKTDAKKLAPYFAGGRKVIKGKINATAAEKYQAALENVGLVIKLEACEITEKEPTASAPTNVQESSTTTNDATGATSGMTIAAAGADIIENPIIIAAQKIDDISAISMANAGADVLENPVKIPAQEIEDISDITLADVGSNVLEHPQKIVAQKIEDISDISLAEAGSDLVENPVAVANASVADTSELSLDEAPK
ncbi:MAG: hypothetical protein JKX75_08650 [Gammaproteobacteria bacterium]|nr:hypothetical protein [Gammaproteobacteria bacterium]